MCVCICVRVDSSSNGVTTRDSLVGNTSQINHEQISVSDKSAMSLPTAQAFTSVLPHCYGAQVTVVQNVIKQFMHCAMGCCENNK